jgi:ABC-type transport system substrate-binding protein
MRVRARRLALVFVAAVVVLAGCSSSAKPAASSAPGTASSAATSGTPSSAPTGTPANSATKRAVERAYAAFFDVRTPLAKSEALLQHGQAFRAALIAAGNSSQGQGAGAEVTAVKQVSPHLARVTFAIKSGGTVLLPNTHGYAVRENGTWTVAARTFCALLSLQGKVPGACNDPSITALPH